MKKTIYIPVITVVILSLSMVIVMDYHRASQLLTASLLENQVLLTREVSAWIDSTITKSKETADVYAQMPLVRGLLSGHIEHAQWARQELNSILKASAGLRRDIDNVIIFDTKGDVLLAASPRDINVAQRPYFQRAMRGESSIDSVLSATAGQRLLFYATPIYNGKAIVGVSYVSFDVDSLNGLWDSFLTQNKGYKIRIISQNGTVLLSSVSSESTSMNIADIQSSVVLDRPPHTPVFFEDGGERIGLWVPIKDSPWRLLVSLNKQKAMEPLGDLLRSSIAVNTLAAVLVIGVVLHLLQTLITRVRAAEAHGREALLKAKAELEGLVALRTETLNAQNAALTLHRESLVTMLETCPVGISVTTASGNILYMNSELVDIFHCTATDSPVSFYTHAEDRATVSEMLHRGEIVRNMEVNMRDGEGNTRHILLSASRIHYDGTEAELRCFFDVSEEYAIKAALEKERSLLRSVLDTIPDMVFFKSPTRQYLTVNAAFERFMGKTSAEIVGLTPDELLRDRPEMLAASANGDRRALAPGNMVRIEERALSPAGETVVLETVRTSCTDDQGRVIGILGLARDITERKRMEREIIQAREAAQAASKAKSEFIANMSHEIRTPMNGIIGLAYLTLQSPLLPPQLKEYINKIDLSAKSLLRIINDILDFSKIEAHKLEIEHVPFDLTELLANIIQPVIPAIEGKQLELLFDFAEDVPTSLVGDPTRLGQIILNLVNNAVKFTEKGHIVVRVEKLSATEAQARLQFTVSDTGMGISPDYLSRLFEAFTQADSSITRRHGGTGLGLTICKRLVALMNGDITVQSVHGEGTSFIFSIPFGLCAQCAPWQGQHDLENATVLVVDDHELSRRILRAYLHGFGASVEEADSGEAALRKFTACKKAGTPYTAVVADWRMPGMDGLEFAAHLRDIAGNNDLPIIMVTAYDRERILHNAKGIGVNFVLTKPVTPSQLHDALLMSLQPGAQTRGAPELPAAEDTRAQGPLAGKRALLAEDNDINQLIAVQLLAGFGMEVTVACNGIETLRQAASDNFDVILMDIQMPEMDGLEAATRLRRNAALDTTPIIAMTAHAMTGDHEKSLTAGMQDHVTKPIDPDELHDTLLLWLVEKKGWSWAEPRQCAA